MSYQTSFRGGGRGRGLAGRYGAGHGRSQPALQIRYPPCSQSMCRARGLCEFRRISQEYDNLLPTINRYWGLGGSHHSPPDNEKQVLGDPRAFLKKFFLPYELRHQLEHPSKSRFKYMPREPVISEFYRMCRAFDWRPPPKERNPKGPPKEPPNPDFIEARNGFRDALAKQFNALYGTDENNLASWQNLCSVLNLSDVPEELEACRNLVASMHVNIIDLIDTPVIQEPVVHFKSEEHLSIYTLHMRKKFPRHNVHSGDLLRFLLRKIDAYDPDSLHHESDPDRE